MTEAKKDVELAEVKESAPAPSGGGGGADGGAASPKALRPKRAKKRQQCSSEDSSTSSEEESPPREVVSWIVFYFLVVHRLHLHPHTWRCMYTLCVLNLLHIMVTFYARFQCCL